jgi:hypothetical protein
MVKCVLPFSICTQFATIGVLPTNEIILLFYSFFATFFPYLFLVLQSFYDNKSFILPCI